MAPDTPRRRYADIVPDGLTQIRKTNPEVVLPVTEEMRRRTPQDPKPPTERGWSKADAIEDKVVKIGQASGSFEPMPGVVIPFTDATVYVGPAGYPFKALLDEGKEVCDHHSPFSVPDRTRDVDATFENEVRPR